MYVVVQQLWPCHNKLKDDFTIQPVLCNHKKSKQEQDVRFIKKPLFLDKMTLPTEKVFTTKEQAEKYKRKRVKKCRRERLRYK